MVEISHFPKKKVVIVLLLVIPFFAVCAFVYTGRGSISTGLAPLDKIPSTTETPTNRPTDKIQEPDSPAHVIETNEPATLRKRVFGHIIFWTIVSLLALFALFMFYILVLHSLIFPNGISTGNATFDETVNFVFDFLKAEDPEFHFEH
jgi:hypothetical protein